MSTPDSPRARAEAALPVPELLVETPAGGREGRQHLYRLVEHPTRPDTYYPEVVAAERRTR